MYVCVCLCRIGIPEPLVSIQRNFIYLLTTECKTRGMSDECVSWVSSSPESIFQLLPTGNQVNGFSLLDMQFVLEVRLPIQTSCIFFGNFHTRYVIFMDHSGHYAGQGILGYTEILGLPLGLIDPWHLYSPNLICIVPCWISSDNRVKKVRGQSAAGIKVQTRVSGEINNLNIGWTFFPDYWNLNVEIKWDL